MDLKFTVIHKIFYEKFIHLFYIFYNDAIDFYLFTY